MIEPTSPAFDALVALYRKRGTLFPGDVIAEARDETSPLHSHFEWDDTAAAHAHRLAQARDLIRTYRVKIVTEEPETISVRAFVHEPDRGGYSLTIDVVDDEARRKAEIERLRRDVAAIVKRLEQFEEFAALADAMSAAVS